jgi:hypothetical protein
MRNLCEPDIAKWRDHDADKMFGLKDEDRAHYGAFLIVRLGTGYLAKRIALRVMATTGEGWDHVSVSLSDRTPTWEEMEFVKTLFFRPDEAAMQLHVPAADHVNNHPFCLHIWRPQKAEIPRPPAILVGIPGVSPDEMRLALGR